LLTGSLLAANVVNSSLQTVGNLSSLVISNALGGTGSITANALTLGTILNATGNITGGNLNTGGKVVAISDGSFGGDVIAVNFTGNVVTGNLTINQINANTLITTNLLSAAGNITGANVNTGNVSATGTVTANAFVGSISTASQPGITTVGTLGSLTVTANITGGNINTGGVVSAAGNISGLNLVTTGAVNGASLSVSGNITGGNVLGGANVNATTHTGTTASLSGNITGGNLVTGGLISATGTMNSGAATIAGNLIASGAVGYINATTVAITDPILSLGRGANNSSLGSATTTDLGSQLYYYDTSEKSAFIGYQLSTGNIVVAKQVSISGEIVTVNTYGNLVAGTLLAQGIVSAVGNIVTTANVSGGNVIAATHLGTTFSASGNVTGGNILGGANVNATTHTGTTVSVSGNVNGGNIISAAALSAASLVISGNTATVTSAGYTIGYRDLPQLGAFGTLAVTDGGKHYYGSGTITIPTNASVALPVGTAILVIASGATTISSGSVTLIWAGVGTTGSRTLAQYGQASLIKVGTDTWYISGTGLT
jgi:hypothetical protein